MPAKPAWLNGYFAYIGAALLLCVLAIVRLADEGGLFAAVMLVPTTAFYSFAAYSLLHWQVSWARKFNLGMNGIIVIFGLLCITLPGGQLPYIVYFIYSLLVVPTWAAIPGAFMQTASPLVVSVTGLAMLGLTAYWAACWLKFVPVAEGSAADLESDELSRNVRSAVRKGIITLCIIGFLALFKALSDGADGNLIWAGIAGLSLFLAVIAMLLTRMFPGEDSLSQEEIEELLQVEPAAEVDPLADD